MAAAQQPVVVSSSGIPEFELTMRIANNLIRARRRALGLTPAELGAIAGVSVQIVYAYESMHDSPFTKAGNWRRSALRVAAALSVAAADLWPDAVQNIKRPVVVAQIGADALSKLAAADRRLFAQHDRLRLELPAPDERLERRSTALELVRLAEQHVNERDRMILERVVCGGETCEVVGKDLNVSGKRVQQLLEKTIHRLREHWRRQHPEVPLPPTPGQWRRRKLERAEQRESRELARQARLRNERKAARRKRRLLALTPEQRAELKRRAHDRAWVARTDHLIRVWYSNNVTYHLRNGSVTDNEVTLTRKLVEATIREAQKYLGAGRPLSIDAWWFMRRVVKRYGTEGERELVGAWKRPQEEDRNGLWSYDRILDWFEAGGSLHK